MPGSVAFRAAVVASTILALSLPALSQPPDAASLRSQTTPSPASIVIGFVGGFVAHDNPHHGPVQLAHRLERAAPQDTYVQVFENRRRKLAYATIVRLLDLNHDGFLSPQEKSRARIILFGHSWGAAAAVLLARDLRRQGIPVLLTVQVDSVAKAWQDDSIIPDNVAAAVNFYQPHGILHGRAHILAADPAKTEILGNYRSDYNQSPVDCPEASWWNHVFTAGHMQSECDPKVWSQIETLVRQRLYPSASPSVSAAVRP